MSCIFENRCLNKHLCFRCFNEKLLKLPEDKERNKNKVVKLYDSVKANSEDSWKDLEEDMVRELKKVPTLSDIRRTRGSGNQWFEKGDVLDMILKLECKERTGNELSGGDKSMSIKKSWLEKATLEAMEDNKVMALPFRFKNDDKNYIIMEAFNITDLVNYLKAYKIDNDIKEQEINFLKEEIRILKEKN